MASTKPTLAEPLQVPKVNQFGIPLLPDGLRERLFSKDETRVGENVLRSAQAWLPDGYSQNFRLFVFGPSGFWTMALLRYAAKFDPFPSLDCATTPSTLAQSKERKGSNFAIWQPCAQDLLRKFDLNTRGEKGDASSSSSSFSAPEMPPLYGNIESHFHHIANEQIAPYCRRIDEFIGAALPPLPKQWSYRVVHLIMDYLLMTSLPY